MTRWNPKFVLVQSCMLWLALAGCGGGDDDQSEVLAAGEALPVSYELQPSTRPLDVGIEGEGLLVLQSKAGGARSYSRYGRLDLDADGRLIHADGALVVGVADEAAPLPAVPLVVAPQATRRVTVVANLDARTTARDPADPFDLQDDGTYDAGIGITVWSADGRSHALTLCLRLVVPGSASRGAQPYWEVRAAVDGVTTATLHTLRFDSSGSRLPESDRILRLPAGDAGLESPLDIDFGSSTQYGVGFAATELNADGYPSGVLRQIDVEADGTLRLRYDNGVSAAGGQVLLARFTVADRLVRSGQSSWSCGPGCSAPALGAPGSAWLGTIRAGALNTVY